MASILVVDDSEAEVARLARVLSVDSTRRVHTCAGGEEVFEIVAADNIDLVIAGQQTGKMDDLVFLEKFQEAFPRVPVILIAKEASEEFVVNAFQQGVSGYLNRKSSAEQLSSMADRLLAERAADLAYRALLRHQELDEYEFKLRSRRVLMSAAAGFLRQRIQVSEICPDKELLRLGIAIEEALLNACLHGNLELDSALREKDGDLFESLADERSEVSPWKDRYVYVRAVVTRDYARVTIRDEGSGFDPTMLPDPTDPENLLKPHGRGVMIMQLFMDEVVWNESGNEVTMIKKAIATADINKTES
ncbi:MAG: ATP-binding protein [Fuerstiella sp.]|nr:ATP-binding protein [Fuerstiella sp.]